MNIYDCLSFLKKYCESTTCDNCEIQDSLGECIRCKDWDINNERCEDCIRYNRQNTILRQCELGKMRLWDSTVCKHYKPKHCNSERVKPLNIKYVSIDFEHVGICPKCGETVINGYLKTDNKCPNCNVELDWDILNKFY